MQLVCVFGNGRDDDLTATEESRHQGTDDSVIDSEGGLSGRADESMKRIRAVYDDLAATGETDGFVCEELAENLLAGGNESAAKEQFVKAWDKLKDEQWLKDAEPARYERLQEFGSP